MKTTILQFVCFTILQFVCLLLNATSEAVEIKIRLPQDYQVIQRTTKAKGCVAISGSLVGTESKFDTIQVRYTEENRPMEWKKLDTQFNGSDFHSTIEVPSGGWYQFDIRAMNSNTILAEARVGHVGVGEVFVVAGQSNSANYGEERLTPKSSKVVNFDGKNWMPANDPQPGASGGGGSFIPPFGDTIQQKLDVPVGFVTCGIGATSVREWLPEGSRFPNPPTILERVRPGENNEWESKGDAFNMLVSRMKELGPHGFRAVLWHQGESDANQPDPTRSLTEQRYREYLEKLILDSRREIEWSAPWFVAQASYHIPGDEFSAEIRAAQASLWKDKIAFEGPDTDAIKGNLREADGQGVHFSGRGQRVHAAYWVEKVVPWLDARLIESPEN